MGLKFWSQRIFFVLKKSDFRAGITSDDVLEIKLIDEVKKPQKSFFPLKSRFLRGVEILDSEDFFCSKKKAISAQASPLMMALSVLEIKLIPAQPALAPAESALNK